MAVGRNTGHEWPAGAVAVGLSLVLLLTVVFVAGRPSGPGSAAEALERTRAFLDAHGSMRATLRMRSEMSDPELAEEDPFAFTMRGTIEADVPDRLRVTTHAFGTATEIVTLGDDVAYTRWAEHARDLPDQLWARYEVDQIDEGIFVEGPGGATTGFASLAYLLRGANHPRIVERGSDTTFSVRMPVDATGLTEVPPGARARALVTIDAGFRPRRIEYVTSADDGETSVRLESFRWDAPVTIVAPDPEDVDPTPEVDEEGLAEFDAVPILQPAAIPEEWGLMSAYVVAEEESWEGCEQVNLYYTLKDAGFDDEVPYLDVYEFEKSCSEGRPRRSTDLRAGPYSGFIAFESDGTNTGEIVVGKTVVQFESDLEPEVIALVLGDLVPFDAEHPSPATVPIGKTA